jgi:hypothetical protein
MKELKECRLRSDRIETAGFSCVLHTGIYNRPHSKDSAFEREIPY